MSKEVSSDSGVAPAETRRCMHAALLCAVSSFFLYLLLPGLAALLNPAVPTHASEIFPWVRHLDNTSLGILQATLADVNGDAAFAACCGGLFALYFIMLRIIKRCESPRAERLVFGAGAAFLLVMVMAPVMLSTDVYAYAFYGRVLSVHGANAYAENPALATDPFFSLFNQQCLVSLYGPLWTLVSAAFTRVTGEQIGLTVLFFRAFSALSTLTAAGFIWKVLRLHAPQYALRGIVFFLWNPLVVLETGLSGHNDITMIALALCGVWLHLRGWKTAAVVAFTLSALVKFITGMFVPLYMLMVLRGMRTWRERAGYVAKCGLCAGLAVVAISRMAHVKSDVPAGGQALATDFYNNNFHEIVFKRLRLAFGEDAASVAVPIHYGSWWAETEEPLDLLSTDTGKGYTLTRIPAGAKLLVIAPDQNDAFRVYDPSSRMRGYISDGPVHSIPDVEGLAPDPVLDQLEMPLMDWPTVVRANLWIRAVTWGLFAAFGLLAAWKTRTFDDFLKWSALALLVSYFLVMTQIWPWYLIWALAFCAFNPGGTPARLAVLLSVCMLSLYVTGAYAGSDEEWIHDYRSLPAVILPLLLLAGSLSIPSLFRGRNRSALLAGEPGC